MTTRLLYTIIFCLLFFHPIHAQNTTRWAIGADLLGLSNINTLPKYGLYARYKLTNQEAIRVRPSYYKIPMQPGIFNIKQQKTYGLRIGYERSKVLYKQQFYLLYGLEYIYYNDHQFSFDYNNPSSQQSFLTLDHREQGGSLFIGCRYFLIPNLSLSTESALQITQTHIVKARVGIDEFTYDFTSSLILPVSNLTLCIHF